MDGNINLRIQGINHKSVAGVNGFFVAQVDMGGGFVNPRASFQLFDKFVFVFKVQINAFFNVFVLQDFVNAVSPAQIHQFHHQRIIGNAEIFKPSQARAGVHDKSQQDPPCRVHDLIHCVFCGIGDVNGFH